MWSIKDKFCLITGATSGIGRETALALSVAGARVMITYRNYDKAMAVREYIFGKSGREIELFFCDFSSLESIRSFVDDFKQKHDQLHVLINNSGIYEINYQKSKDGYELTWAVNHLAPFLLTKLLVDTLKASAPARIINVASESHRGARINLKVSGLSKDFSGKRAYDQSKLANILFTKQLAHQLKDTGVSVNCLHPGIVSTNIFNKMNPLAIFLFKLIMITPEKGAETTVFLASSPEVEGITGQYFRKKKISEPSENAKNLDTAEKLWQLSLDQVEFPGFLTGDNPEITKYYSNGEITIVWKPHFCTHVAYCFTELPEVFNPDDKPWINPYGASTKKIIRQVERCPTEALTFFYNNRQNDKIQDNDQKNEDSRTQIRIIRNGPAIIKGKSIITDKNGRETEISNNFSICRCGKSEIGRAHV